MSEKETPNYYAIIPANVRYDKTLTANAKLLYGEITALCNEKGFCWASNSYFAELYEVTPQAISKWVNSLSDKGYLRLEYEYNGKEIKTRKMYISDVSTKDSKVSTQGLGVSINNEKGVNKRLKGYQQKVKENNTSKNNTSNNTYNKETQDKPAKSPKHKHGEYKHVLLTSDEYQRLCEEWGEQELLRMIKIFDEGIEIKGYKYKNHNLALRKWKGNEKNTTGYSKPLHLPDQVPREKKKCPKCGGDIRGSACVLCYTNYDYQGNEI